jgi:acyl-CoA reductase-like NAD-dependent aldehyde dehydrogenase
MPSHTHLIAGTSVESGGLERLDLVDPASGGVVADIPAGDAIDADRAVAAARKAAVGWARTPVGERAAALHRLADAVDAHRDELARLQTLENGKPLHMSSGDVATAAATLRQYAELGPVHRGRSLVGRHDAVDMMVNEPYGVAALIVPWNDPLGILSGLLGAALVTGNAVVVKPSERATLAVLRMVGLLDVPAGVANVLLGDGRAGAALVEHPEVDLVCHVGSVETGRVIGELCARLVRPCILELGGNDPLVVDAGVDPAWAAAQAAAGAFANAGQICTSVERIYVHAEVADAFVEALVAEAEALTVGDPGAPDTQMGPLVDHRHRDGVHAAVEAAVAAGARCLTGGALPDGEGAFYPPTVLVDVTDDMAVMATETFGPVAPVQVVSSFDEALEAAARTPYGLAASVLTTSQSNAQRAWRELPVGTVKINDVWGGAPGGAAEPHGVSGRGFGYGPELLDEVTTTKVVHYGPAPRAGS